MHVLENIYSAFGKRKLHFTLIDPDKQEPEGAGRIAFAAEGAGTDAIMVGGSGKISQELVDETVRRIKERTPLPVILFPSGASFLSRHADAILFMSLLNSRNPKYLAREQAKAAPFVKRLGIEPIPMGYIIVEPGMTVGRVGEADLVKRDETKTAVGYAMAAQYFGMKIVYLEAGSGAPQPIPAEMISAVKSSIDVPLIVGGGIRDGESATMVAKAGADIIVTGRIVENSSDVLKMLKPIIDAIHGSEK
ncbi:MAG: geranylgeranylglyceryl/heptaprenylglyceryl phosphate synthase [Thermoplasmata archaeon HGW-Thermoplasmata-2]|nr:MAG: geranylgeranylglyceryl/heptaprenylglyceryl phosphate synthase [Thermoplasmata archaeon HGW-Thermoplasmata-2]